MFALAKVRYRHHMETAFPGTKAGGWRVEERDRGTAPAWKNCKFQSLNKKCVLFLGLLAAAGSLLQKGDLPPLPGIWLPFPSLPTTSVYTKETAEEQTEPCLLRVPCWDWGSDTESSLLLLLAEDKWVPEKEKEQGGLVLGREGYLWKVSLKELWSKGQMYIWMSTLGPHVHLSVLEPEVISLWVFFV